MLCISWLQFLSFLSSEGQGISFCCSTLPSPAVCSAEILLFACVCPPWAPLHAQRLGGSWLPLQRAEP